MQICKVWIIVSVAALIAAGFLVIACGTKNDHVNNNNLMPVRDYVVSPGHQTPQSFEEITAEQITANIKLGWNLGNTFDAAGDGRGFHWLGGGIYVNTSVREMETAWGNPATTRANINAIKNAGFNTIRIPVTWYKALDNDNIIREDWLRRVTEVVNWAEENDMYIILNTHHDETIFKFTNTEIENSLSIFERVWKQIATQFKNYNEKLIFEALNEPRTKGVQHEWTGGIPEERNNLNRYYQVFVDTVRASGGNNDKRILMVNTYGASSVQAAVDGLVLPNDVPNKIIVSIHAYMPYNFALNTNSAFNRWSAGNSSDTSPIINALEPAYRKFVNNGIPVIMGEFGAMNKNNAAVRAEWAEFYVSEARKRNIPCVWWDNGAFQGDGELFGLLNRRDNTFPYPEIVEALKRGAGI